MTANLNYNTAHKWKKAYENDPGRDITKKKKKKNLDTTDPLDSLTKVNLNMRISGIIKFFFYK